MATAPEPKPKLSPAEQLKKLDEARAKIEEDRAKNDEARSKILEAAKTDVIAKITPLLEELQAMGFEHRLVEGKAVTRTTNPEKICPICNFKTDPVHDKRAHRSQKSKTPFTDADLTRLGMTKQLPI